MTKQAFFYQRLLMTNLIILFVLTGCATKQMELTKSGFLSSYENLEEDKKYKGMYVYKNPTVNISKKYSKIMIAPVEFKLDEEAVEEYKLSEEDKQKLVDYFREKLVEGLSKNYIITDAPGEGVLIFKTAITDILPNKVYLNLHWSTTLIGAGIGGASLEAELADSVSGERILTFIDARKGRKLNYTKGLTKWGHTKEVLGIWAKLIVENLDKMRMKYDAVEEAFEQYGG